MNLLEEMQQCCEKLNLPEDQAIQTYALLINLSEVEKLWNVTWECNATLKKLYCKAKRSQNGPIVNFILVSSHSPFSLKEIEEMQDNLKTNSICLAIRGSDMAFIYYDVQKGLVEAPIDIRPIRENLKYRKKQYYTQALTYQDTAS